MTKMGVSIALHNDNGSLMLKLPMLPFYLIYFYGPAQLAFKLQGTQTFSVSHRSKYNLLRCITRYN